MKKYKIYQVKRDLTRELGFMGLGTMEHYGVKIDLKNYDEVHSGEIDDDGLNVYTLNKLFEQFNVNYPDGYAGRSMSVSDIVEIDDEHYYCNTLGWTKVELEVKVKKDAT